MSIRANLQLGRNYVRQIWTAVTPLRVVHSELVHSWSNAIAL